MSSLYYDKIKFAVTALWKSYRFSNSLIISHTMEFWPCSLGPYSETHVATRKKLNSFRKKSNVREIQSKWD